MKSIRANKSALLLLLVIGCGLLLFFSFKKKNQSGTTQITVPEKLEVPSLTQTRPEQVIEHTGYTVSYNPDWCIPNWVAYELTDAECEGTEERAKHFEPDPDVKGFCPSTKDYSNSGYDRGHMAPAGDMKWSEQAMRESFYLSNICPQNHNLNSGDWKSLEEKVRSWSKEFQNVYVTCGPVVSAHAATIGEHNITVPDAFFKVVLCQNNGQWQSIGFYFDNKAGHKPLRTYCKTVDEIETITGIDFFPMLEDSIENIIEAACSPNLWGL